LPGTKSRTDVEFLLFAVQTADPMRHAQEAEAHRVAGEIAMLSPHADAARAEAYFERALAVAQKQQARSCELRAAMSMARLWRDQGKPQKTRELLVPVYAGLQRGSTRAI
jgi:predicted ATPase